EMGSQGEGERSPFFVPDPVAVAGDHTKPVIAWWNLVVKGDAAGFRIHPLVIKPLQFVFEEDSFRSDETQGGVLKPELTRAGQKPGGRKRIELLFSDPDLLDQHGRGLRIHTDVERIDHGDAVGGRKPKLAVFAFVAGRLVGTFALDRFHSVGKAV